MATCPTCRAPHAHHVSTRPLGDAEIAPALRIRQIAAESREALEQDLNHLEQIRAAHRRLAGRRRTS